MESDCADLNHVVQLLLSHLKALICQHNLSHYPLVPNTSMVISFSAGTHHLQVLSMVVVSCEPAEWRLVATFVTHEMVRVVMRMDPSEVV